MIYNMSIPEINLRIVVEADIKDLPVVFSYIDDTNSIVQLDKVIGERVAVRVYNDEYVGEFSGIIEVITYMKQFPMMRIVEIVFTDIERK